MGVFFFSPTPEGKITYTQKPRVACFKAMDKIQIFENVFHGNYVKFHGPAAALSHSLDALICIEIVIICSFQGENCIFLIQIVSCVIGYYLEKLSLCIRVYTQASRLLRADCFQKGL